MASLDVIPAEAGIQSSYGTLGPGLRRGDHRCVTQLRKPRWAAIEPESVTALQRRLAPTPGSKHGSELFALSDKTAPKIDAVRHPLQRRRP